MINTDKFKNLGDTLMMLRKEKKLHQSDVAELLSERGITLTNQAIRKWETGKAVPDAIQFLNLCDILGVEDVMAIFSDDCTRLNADGRKMVMEFAQFLAANPKYAQDSDSASE